MLSSAQISAMLQQQQQSYAQQVAYAQAIAPAYQPTFSNQNTEFQGAFGNRVAGAAVSGATNIGLPLATTTIGLATGVNAFSAGFAGVRAGWGVGAALGGAGAAGVGMGVGGAALAGAAAVLPFYAAGKAIDYAGQRVYQGAYQSAFLGTTLNQGPWGGMVNQGSRGGYGFSRGEIRGIGGRMEGMSDAYTSVMDIYRSMGKLGQMGFGSLETDSKRFTEYMTKSIKTVKELAKFLNTTMDEALPLFAESKRMGIYGGTDILRNAMGRGRFLEMGGMSQQQRYQLGMQGAATAQAWGARRGTGARAFTTAAGLVQAAGMSGVLSEEDLMEATGGLTGPDAYAHLGSALMNEAYSRTRGGLGRRMTAGFLRRGKDGTLTVDAKLAQRYASGNMSIGEIQSRAQENLKGTGRLAFVANEKRLAGEVVEAGGPMLGVQMAMARLGDVSNRSDDWLKFMLQRSSQLDEGQIDAAIKMLRKRKDFYDTYSRKILQDKERKAYDVLRAREHSWEGWKSKASWWLMQHGGRGLEHAGANAFNDMAGGVEAASDLFWGRWRAPVDEGSMRRLRQQMSRGKGIDLRSGGQGFGPDLNGLEGWQRTMAAENGQDLNTAGGQASFWRSQQRITRGTGFNDYMATLGTGSTRKDVREAWRRSVFSSDKLSYLTGIAREGGGHAERTLPERFLFGTHDISSEEAERALLAGLPGITPQMMGSTQSRRELLSGLGLPGMGGKTDLTSLSAEGVRKAMLRSVGGLSAGLSERSGTFFGKDYGSSLLDRFSVEGTMWGAGAAMSGLGGLAGGLGRAVGNRIGGPFGGKLGYLAGRAGGVGSIVGDWVLDARQSLLDSGVLNSTDVSAFSGANIEDIQKLQDMLAGKGGATADNLDFLIRADEDPALKDTRMYEEAKRSLGFSSPAMEAEALRIRRDQRLRPDATEGVQKQLKTVLDTKMALATIQASDTLREGGRYLSWKAKKMIGVVGKEASDALVAIGEGMEGFDGYLDLSGGALGANKDKLYAALRGAKRTNKKKYQAMLGALQEMGYAGGGLARGFEVSALEDTNLFTKKGDTKGIQKVLGKLGLTEEQAQDAGIYDTLVGGVNKTNVRSLKEGAQKFHEQVGAAGVAAAGSGRNLNELTQQVFEALSKTIDSRGYMKVWTMNSKGEAYTEPPRPPGSAAPQSGRDQVTVGEDVPVGTNSVLKP